MLKIPNIEQIRSWDAATISRKGISSFDLMERAAAAFVEVFVQHNPVGPVLAVCGKGNNGGDGLAVLRKLQERGYSCAALIIDGDSKASIDFKKNLEHAEGRFPFRLVSTSDQINFSTAPVIIDALFGSGLSRRPEGLFADGIQAINQSGKKIVAIDIPSGLLADQPTEWPVVQADETITFQTPKLAFLMPFGITHIGKLFVADISLDTDFYKEYSSSHLLIQEDDVRNWILPRKVNAHKGDFGHALIMAGSYGMMGAAVLASRAALQSGAGKVTAAVPACGYEIMQASVPEVMTLTDSSRTSLSVVPDLEKYQAIGIGPGIGMSSETVKCLMSLIERSSIPMVFDADALNIIAAHSSLLLALPANCILTPHPGEFRRLVGDWKDDFERLRLLHQFSKRTKAVVVLKGACTSIAVPSGEVYFNTTGTPFMATAGSGDVLTGMIVSFLAQGLDPVKATVAAVYLHGLAGEEASAGQHPILAGDIISSIPKAWIRLFPGQ